MNGNPMGDEDGGPLTAIVSVLVTGTWLAALSLGFDWWLVALLIGYVVVVPVTAIVENNYLGSRKEVDDEEEEERDPIEELRRRYAEGEIDEMEFERRVERLVETEDVTEGDAMPEGIDTNRERNRDREFER